MKKLFKENSKYLIILTILELILSIICILSFVYTDTLNYADSEVITTMGVEKLLESVYSSTWWALILFLLSFISIFSLTTLVYRKLDYLFVSIMCWVMMFILAINLHNSITINLSICALFIPIIIINIIVYNKEKEKLARNERKQLKKVKAGK